MASRRPWYKRLIKRQNKYVRRTVQPRYIPVFVYKHSSISNVAYESTRLIEEIFYYTQQTFAWNNIGIIVKEVYFNFSMQIDDLSMAEIMNKFHFNPQHHLNHSGVHILFIDKNEKTHENAQIIGYSYEPTQCQMEQMFSIIRLSKRKDPEYFAATLLHEFGHMFSSDHDNDISKCFYGKYSCIMFEQIVPLNFNSITRPMFSFATSKKIVKFVEGCQFDATYDNKLNLKGYDKCGNGIVDHGEECDCGFRANCRLTGEFKCCHMRTCKFKKGAQCASGECCENCKFTKKVCRNSTGECDQNVRCTYGNTHCQHNNFKPDGTKCSSGYCAGGQCPNLNLQCSKLMEVDSVFVPSCMASYSTYVNKSCDNHLAAGYNKALCTYRNSSSPCGKIFCHTDNRTGKWNAGFYDSQARTICKMRTPTSATVARLSFSPNGYECDNGKMCLNKKCIDAEENANKCRNSRCKPGMICENGVCVYEVALDKLCDDIICSKNQVCAYGKCINDPKYETETMVNHTQNFLTGRWN